MSTENSSHDAATPAHIDIATTARALIIQRDEWQEKWIKTELSPFPGLSAKDRATHEEYQKQQFHLKEIAEERTNVAIPKLPEHDRQAAKEEVQKILTGEHDDELKRDENNAPVWSKHVNSALAQELLSEARVRTWQSNTPEALQRHKEAIEQQTRSAEPPKERGRDRDRD